MKGVALCAALLILAGCDSSGRSSSYSVNYYDHGFRYGIYDEHYDVDVDIDRPDRPRPPPGVEPGRPRPPVARPNRPTTRPARSPRRMC